MQGAALLGWVEERLAPDSRKAIQRLEQSVNRLTWMLVAVGLLLAFETARAAFGALRLGLGTMIVAHVTFQVSFPPGRILSRKLANRISSCLLS